ncbi:uncharacterized protein LOC126674615 isoform X2 [Mercurialis annua]|uniref:uncharacterized protein LOC126674615 isoform X2 n=1 Tax=Mercurialis annua TaxID=3986 RepID=UPI0024ACB121|nr:uncharacterized protein LOC126674615 isoform X2 [Mercurialis annua]
MVVAAKSAVIDEPTCAEQGVTELTGFTANNVVIEEQVDEPIGVENGALQDSDMTEVLGGISATSSKKQKKKIDKLGDILSCSNTEGTGGDDLSDADIANMNRINGVRKDSSEVSSQEDKVSKTRQIGHDLGILQRETRSATLRKLAQKMGSTTGIQQN